MIKSIITALKSFDWYVDDEDIQIAKGKYKIPVNIKEYKDNKKRWQPKT